MPKDCEVCQGTGEGYDGHACPVCRGKWVITESTDDYDLEPQGFTYTAGRTAGVNRI